MAADISFIAPRANAAGAQTAGSATSGGVGAKPDASGSGAAGDAFLALVAQLTGNASAERAGARRPDGAAPRAGGEGRAAPASQSANAADGGEETAEAAGVQPGAAFVNTPQTPVRIGPGAAKTLPAQIDDAALQAAQAAASSNTGEAGARRGGEAKAAAADMSANDIVTPVAVKTLGGEGAAAPERTPAATGEPAIAKPESAVKAAEPAKAGEADAAAPKTGDAKDGAATETPAKDGPAAKPAAADDAANTASAARGAADTPAAADGERVEAARTGAGQAEADARSDGAASPGAKPAEAETGEAKARSGAVEAELRALRRADERGDGRVGAHERARAAQGEASGSDVQIERGAERRAARADLMSARGGAEAAQPGGAETRPNPAQPQAPAFANAQGALAPGLQTPAQTAPGADPALGGAIQSDPAREASAEAVRGDRGEARADIARANTAAPHAASQRFAPQTAQTLAAQIARRAADGAKVFDIRLDPPELGRVEVKLEIRSGERVSAVLSAEKPEALAELQRSARDLERALSEAGLELEENGLSFQLSEGGEDQARPDGRHEGGFQIALDDGEPGAGPAAPGPANYYGFTLSARAGVDVRV